MNTIDNMPIKTVIVKLTSDNICEFDINTDIFDDPLLEASTQAIEKIRKNKYGIVNAITECWFKKTPKKTYIYNSYWLLVNAACYQKAEQLREKFKLQTKCDLANEPLHGKNYRTSTI